MPRPTKGKTEQYQDNIQRRRNNISNIKNQIKRIKARRSHNIQDIEKLRAKLIRMNHSGKTYPTPTDTEFKYLAALDLDIILQDRIQIAESMLNVLRQ